MPECLLPRCHCFVRSFCFFFFGWGGGERGVQVRVMDSLVLSFGVFFMVFCWVFGGGVEGGWDKQGKRMRRRGGRRW